MLRDASRYEVLYRVLNIFVMMNQRWTKRGTNGEKGPLFNDNNIEQDVFSHIKGWSFSVPSSKITWRIKSSCISEANFLLFFPNHIRANWGVLVQEIHSFSHFCENCLQKKTKITNIFSHIPNFDKELQRKKNPDIFVFVFVFAFW